MLVLCPWCAAQDRPSFLREKPPYRDTRLSHSVCPDHAAEQLALLRRQARSGSGDPVAGR